MSQMLLVESINCAVRIGLDERDRGLGITGKVGVFFLQISLFTLLTQIVFTLLRYARYQV